MNSQNIVGEDAVFERLIDYPGWPPLVRRHVNPVYGLSIH